MQVRFLQGAPKFNLSMKSSLNKSQIKLKIYTILLLIIWATFFVFNSTFFITLAVKLNKKISFVFCCLSLLFGISTIILYFLYDRQKRIVMNNSIKFYKQRLHFIIFQCLIVLFFLSISAILNREFKNLNYNTLLNITISITSLNFLVLTFVIPHVKARIDSLIKNGKKKKEDEKGKIYNFIQKYNQSYVVVVISIILLFIYILAVVTNNDQAINVFLLLLLFYNSYVIIKLITSIKSIFWINLNDVEDKLKDNDKSNKN